MRLDEKDRSLILFLIVLIIGGIGNETLVVL